MPPGAGAAPPGQPPFGSSPATGATTNPGLAAKGMQAAGALLNGMAMVIPLVGAQTPLGQAFAKAMIDIGKELPPGATSPQGEQNFLQQMAMRQQQMMPQRAAVGGAPPGAAPPPGGAPPPPPPMPQAA